MTKNKRAKRRNHQYAEEHGLTYQQAQAARGQVAEASTPSAPAHRPHPDCPHCQRSGLQTSLHQNVSSIGDGTLVLHGRWDPSIIVELGVRFADPHDMGFEVTGYAASSGEDCWRDAFDCFSHTRAIRILGSADARSASLKHENRILFGGFLVIQRGRLRRLDPASQRETFVQKANDPDDHVLGLPLVHLVR